jgi:biotin carboxylase
MQRALDEMVIDGIPTNIAFLQQIMADRRYQANELSTAFLPQLMSEVGLSL